MEMKSRFKYDSKISPKQLEEILELSKSITSTFAWDEILESIVKKAVQLIPGADTGNIFIYRDNEDLLIPEFGWGFARGIFQQIRIKPGESISGQVFLSRKPTLYKTPTEIADVMADLQKDNHEYYRQIVPGYSGFQSSLCAPLIWKDKCLGVLSVHNVFSPAQFTNDHLRVIEYVATHAAVALANSMLYEQQRIYVKKLEKSVNVHEKLTQIVLNGVGLERLAIELAVLLSQSVFIFDTLLDCVAKGLPLDEKLDELPIPSEKEIQLIRKRRRPVILESTLTGIDHYIGVTISAGETILGYLVVGITDPDLIELEQLTTIERGAMVIALEMMKKKVEYETEQRLKADLLEEVLQGNITKNTSRKFSFIGYDPSMSYICMACTLYPSHMGKDQSGEEQSQQVIQSFCKKYPGMITFFKSDSFIIFYPLDRSKDESEEQFKEIYRHVKNFVDKLYKISKISVQVGVGRLFHNIKEIHISYKEAKQTLVLLQKYGRGDLIWTYRSLGPLRFLLEVAGEDVLQEYMKEILGPLLDKHSKLLETLISWFSNERQIKRTSEDLFVHTNTVVYRLNKIEELLNVSLRDEDDLLTVQIALRLWQTLHSDTDR